MLYTAYSRCCMPRCIRYTANTAIQRYTVYSVYTLPQAKAKYAWFEMLALADLLKWCAEGEAEGVRARLRGVAERLAASKEELEGVLGEGVL